MQERVKVFAVVTGHGETAIQPLLEDHVNRWLATVEGQIVEITQSESERGGASHVTVCVWYLPAEAQPAPTP